MTSRDYTRLLETYDRFFHAIVRRCHLTPNHSEYDDYLQLARLRFIMCLKQLPDDFSLEHPKNRGYLFQNIYWHLLDDLKKERLREGRHPLLTDDQLKYETNETTEATPLEQLENQELFKQLLEHLPPQEQRLLLWRLTHHTTRREYQHRFALSKSTLYRQQQHIKKVFSDLTENSDPF